MFKIKNNDEEFEMYDNDLIKNSHEGDNNLFLEYPSELKQKDNIIKYNLKSIAKGYRTYIINNVFEHNAEEIIHNIMLKNKDFDFKFAKLNKKEHKLFISAASKGNNLLDTDNIKNQNTYFTLEEKDIIDDIKAIKPVTDNKGIPLSFLIDVYNESIKLSDNQEEIYIKITKNINDEIGEKYIVLFDKTNENLILEDGNGHHKGTIYYHNELDKFYYYPYNNKKERSIGFNNASNNHKKIEINKGKKLLLEFMKFMKLNIQYMDVNLPYLKGLNNKFMFRLNYDGVFLMIPNEEFYNKYVMDGEIHEGREQLLINLALLLNEGIIIKESFLGNVEDPYQCQSNINSIITNINHIIDNAYVEEKFIPKWIINLYKNKNKIKQKKIK